MAKTFDMHVTLRGRGIVTDFTFPISMICIQCKHYQIDDKEFFQCEAFPEKIPDEILNGGVDHTKPWPNEDNRQDNNLVFEQGIKPSKDFYKAFGVKED